MAKKPERQEKPKLLTIPEQKGTPMRLLFNLPLHSKPRDSDKKEPQNPLLAIRRTSIEVHKFDQININSDASPARLGTRSEPTAQMQKFPEKKRLSLFIPKQDPSTFVNINSYQVSNPSFGQLQSQMNIDLQADRVRSDATHTKRMSVLPQFNVSIPEKVHESHENFQEKKPLKKNLEFMQNNLTPLNPHQKHDNSGFDQITNDYLYNVFSNKKGATPKNNQVPSMHDQFGRRGSFSVFRTVVEAELVKRY